jgi:hypothetical protein
VKLWDAGEMGLVEVTKAWWVTVFKKKKTYLGC